MAWNRIKKSSASFDEAIPGAAGPETAPFRNDPAVGKRSAGARKKTLFALPGENGSNSLSERSDRPKKKEVQRKLRKI